MADSVTMTRTREEIDGLQDIEAGEGMVVKRSVSVTYVRPK